MCNIINSNINVCIINDNEIINDMNNNNNSNV